MNQEEILEIIKELLQTDFELDFLLKLDQAELETLTVCIRSRLEEERDEGGMH